MDTRVELVHEGADVPILGRTHKSRHRLRIEVDCADKDRRSNRKIVDRAQKRSVVVVLDTATTSEID